MRILVIGAGAMGSLIAARLALAGDDVALYGRPSPHVQAIQRRGLRLEELDGDQTMVPLPVITEPRLAGGVDMAVVAVKAWATRNALQPLGPHLHPRTALLSIQNGLGNTDAIRDIWPEHDVIAGVTSQGALRPEPGTVRHTGHGPTVIGRRSGVVDDRLRHIATTLSDAGLPTVAVAGIERWLWQKVAINAAINGPTALAGVPNGAIAADPRLRQVAAVLAGEVATVARGHGIELDRIEAAVSEVATATTANRSSMLQDLEAGRRTEVAAIYDAVIAAGERTGVDTPALRVISGLIHAREGTCQDSEQTEDTRE